MRSFDGAVVMVSHDRYLLDETVGEIAELDRRQGPHVAGQLLRLHRRARAGAAAPAADVRDAAEGDRPARGGHPPLQALGEHRRRRARTSSRRATSSARSTAWRRSSVPCSSGARWRSSCARTRAAASEWSSSCRVGVELGERRSCSDVDLPVLRGERVGVVGDNGAGKRVLLRVLAGELEPDARASAGSGRRSGSATLRRTAAPTIPKATPLELVRRAAPISRAGRVAAGAVPLQLRAGAPPDRHAQRRRAERLQLLLLMLEGANCLLLDEPTNHLDIESAEVLEGALEAYDGTAVVISHDRYFLDRVEEVAVVGDRRSPCRRTSSSAASSTSTESMSRWLVGSSSSRQFGALSISSSSCSRVRSPPESVRAAGAPARRGTGTPSAAHGVALGDRRRAPHELAAASPAGRRVGGPGRGSRARSTARPSARPRSARARRRASAGARTCRRRWRRRRRPARRAAPSGRRRQHGRSPSSTPTLRERDHALAAARVRAERERDLAPLEHRPVDLVHAVDLPLLVARLLDVPLVDDAARPVLEAAIASSSRAISFCWVT